MSKFPQIKNPLKYVIAGGISFFVIASALFLIVHTADPDQVENPKGIRYRLKAKSFKRKAEYLVEQEEYKEALVYYEKYKKVEEANYEKDNPRFIPLHAAYIEIFENTNNKEDLIPLYEKIIRLQLKDLDTYMEEVISYYRKLVHLFYFKEKQEIIFSLYKEIEDALKEKYTKVREAEVYQERLEIALSDVHITKDNIDLEFSKKLDLELVENEAPVNEEESDREEENSTEESAAVSQEEGEATAIQEMENPTPVIPHSISPQQSAEELMQIKKRLNQCLEELHLSVALLFFHKGEYEKAFEKCQLSLNHHTALLTKKEKSADLVLASYYKSLGLTCYERKDFNLAEKLFQEAEKIYIAVKGEKSLEAAAIYNSLGIVYFAQGDATNSEPLLQKGLAIRLDKLGENHPDVAASYHNLGLVSLIAVGDRSREDAEEYFRKAEAIWGANPEEHLLNLGKVKYNLFFLIKAKKRFIEAEKTIKEVIVFYEKTLPKNHPLLGEAYLEKAILARIQRKYAQAILLLDKAHDIFIRNPKTNGILLAQTFDCKGDIHFLESKYAEAIAFYNQALKLFLAEEGSVTDDEAIERIRNKIAASKRKLNREEDADYEEEDDETENEEQ